MNNKIGVKRIASPNWFGFLLEAILVVTGATICAECVGTFKCHDGCLCTDLLDVFGRELDCSGQELDKIPAISVGIQLITAVDFSENSFSILNGGDLGRFTQLRRVAFTDNHLDYINPRVFNSTKTISSIQYVDFSGNHLHKISECFQHLDEYTTRLDNLTTLILSNNEIGPTVEDYSFNGLKNLETLDLSWNSIKAIEDRTLKYLNNIKHVDLSYNALETIPSTLFGRLSTLETLRLTGNRLKTIPAGIPSNTKVLELGGNSIAAITTEQGKILFDLPNLTTLNLTFNKLGELVPQAFKTMSKLKWIDLSNNALNRMYPNSFTGASSLEYIFLNRNPLLKELPKDIFTDLRSLRFLFLYRCSLTTLEIGSPSISPLSTEFSSSVTSENVEVDPSLAPKLEALWLFGNPVNCDCKLLPLIWFINARNLTLDADLDEFTTDASVDISLEEYLRKDGAYNGSLPISDTHCISPTNRHNSVVGLQIMDVPEVYLICPNQSLYVTVALFMGIGLFTAAIPTVFLLVSVYLSVAWIVKKKCWPLCSKGED